MTFMSMVINSGGMIFVVKAKRLFTDFFGRKLFAIKAQNIYFFSTV